MLDVELDIYVVKANDPEYKYIMELDLPILGNKSFCFCIEMDLYLILLIKNITGSTCTNKCILEHTYIYTIYS